MHLQQTKVGSRTSGGPQYFFHDLVPHVKEFLRRRGSCPVVLQTPYGIASSPFMAVGKDHKLGKDGKAISGKVGHDRIQQGSGGESIGEAIRYWYGLKGGLDFERIDLEVEIHPKGHFIVIPVGVTMRGTKRKKLLERIESPLSFFEGHESKFWTEQIKAKKHENPADVSWAAAQISQVVAQNRKAEASHIHESDLLRTSGALSILGVNLGPYLIKGYDCLESRFQFNSLPTYPCPVEIKKKSAGFNYQVTRYKELPRAVVLCLDHTFKNPPRHIDFVALTDLAKYLSN